MRDEVPRGVQPKGGRYYLVVADGKKRIWHKLSKVKEGLPALYTALAKKQKELARPGGTEDNMPWVVAAWEREVMVRHTSKTQSDDKAYGRVIASAFQDFASVADIETPDCSEFLSQFVDKPRTYNAYRFALREYFRFAEEKGKRPAGSNPIQSIRTMRVRPRTRCPSTSELRRAKIGCLYFEYSDDSWKRERQRTRSGMTMACLIELAYLSGQDVSVMVRLREARDPMAPDEPHVFADGIYFRRDKTGHAVVIEWSPRLVALVSRLRALKAEIQLKKRAKQRVTTAHLFTKQDGQPLTYSAVANAWRRGLKRVNVLPFQFRDIRARALTDKDAREGIKAANAMGTHTTESQTADYIRRKTARRTKANS